MVRTTQTVLSTLEVGMGGYLIADGVPKVVDYILKSTEIRKAIYQKASSITPWIIEKADSLANKVDYPFGVTLEIATGVALLGMGYFFFKGEEKSKNN